MCHSSSTSGLHFHPLVLVEIDMLTTAYNIHACMRSGFSSHSFIQDSQICSHHGLEQIDLKQLSSAGVGQPYVS